MTTVDPPAPTAHVAPDPHGLVTLIDHRPGHGGTASTIGWSSRTAWCGCPRRRVRPADLPARRSDVDRHDHARFGYITGNYVDERSGHGPVLTCRCPSTRTTPTPTAPVPAAPDPVVDDRAVAVELVAALLAGDGARAAALVGAADARRVELGDAVDMLLRLIAAEAAATIGRPHAESPGRARRAWAAIVARGRR